MQQLASPAHPRRVLGNLGQSPNARSPAIFASKAFVAPTPGSKASGPKVVKPVMKKATLVPKASPAPISSPEGEAFGVRGVFSRTRGPAPPVIEAAWGEVGVLQSEKGPPPQWALEKAAAAAEAERAAFAIAEFVRTHPDAELLSGGKVRCSTTGHEIPLDLFWLKVRRLW